MDNQNNNNGTTRRGIELIDGHTYRNGLGQEVLLVLATELVDLDKIREVLTKNNIAIPEGDLQIFKAEGGMPFFFAGFRRGIPGVFPEDVADEYGYTLVEDITKSQTPVSSSDDYGTIENGEGEMVPRKIPEDQLGMMRMMKMFSPPLYDPRQVRFDTLKDGEFFVNEVPGPDSRVYKRVAKYPPRVVGCAVRVDGGKEMFNFEDDKVIRTNEHGEPLEKDPRNVVLLGTLKDGDKFTSANHPFEKVKDLVYTRVGNGPLEEVGSVRGPDGNFFMGHADDKVVLLERAQAEKKEPKKFPLRLPLVSGRRYVTRDGRVTEPAGDVLFGKDVEEPCIFLDVPGDPMGNRGFRLKDGTHLYNETALDLIAEADAPEAVAAKAA